MIEDEVPAELIGQTNADQQRCRQQPPRHTSSHLIERRTKRPLKRTPERICAPASLDTTYLYSTGNPAAGNGRSSPNHCLNDALYAGKSIPATDSWMVVFTRLSQI